MASSSRNVPDDLDLSKLVITRSFNKNNKDLTNESRVSAKTEPRIVDFVGQPVKSIEEVSKHLSVVTLDESGYVKKRILESGAGEVINEDCTIEIAYSGYVEKDPEPFDGSPIQKPLVVDVKETGLLPGLLLGVKSMLVGEMSMFIITHQMTYGDIGSPPRVMPRAICVFYVKVLKSILTYKKCKLVISKPRMVTDNDEKPSVILGEPVKSIEKCSKHPSVVALDGRGYVKKRILEAGAGEEIHEGCTVYINYAGYFENASEPFDYSRQPQKIDMKYNPILPGLLIGVQSMLVGEFSMFILTHHWMYGPMGHPPRIRPKASSVFYVRLLKCIPTPQPSGIDFQEVRLEAESQLNRGRLAFMETNYHSAIGFFKIAVNILQRAKVEEVEQQREEMLIKLHTNLALCYVKVEQPLKACAACIDVSTITNIWDNCKIMYINGKALRMIGSYTEAEKRLNRALELSPNEKIITAELVLLKKEKEEFEQNKTDAIKAAAKSGDLVSQSFKNQVNKLIKDFKMNPEAMSLEMPTGLEPAKVDYITEKCIKEYLGCNTITLDDIDE